MRREQVFWGWGEAGDRPPLPAHASELLHRYLGVSGDVVAPPVSLDDVRLRPPALPAELCARLEAIAGAANVRDDREVRVLRCRGKSYLDLLAQRAGDCLDAPDAVVAPAGHEQVLAVVQACADAGVAVVPFGGGTSVVGGLEPDRAGFGGLVSLDLGRMDAVIAVDEHAMTAVVEPGIRLPDVEEALGAHGVTLGHLPQSYEWASVGGCVAARSAGQASSGFGRMDDLVESVRLAAPAGSLETLAVPASAAGPRLDELVMGSEGMLGVITRVTLRVRARPSASRYEGWMLDSFAEAIEALRTVAQGAGTPDVARLSDAAETRLTLDLAGGEGLKGRAGEALLRLRGVAEGCLLVVGFEGTPEEVARRRAATARRLRKAGAVALGRAPGEAWRSARFSGPYLRDHLLDRGVLVETLETATTWPRLEALHEAVGAALGQALPGAHVGCHVSHLYRDGASLYFTVLAAQDAEDPAGQWRGAKAAATEALVTGGGTITHHHGVGREHAPSLGAEIGPLGLELLRAVKERCDPAGVMNPGKLLSLEAARRP